MFQGYAGLLEGMYTCIDIYIYVSICIIRIGDAIPNEAEVAQALFVLSKLDRAWRSQRKKSSLPFERIVIVSRWTSTRRNIFFDIGISGEKAFLIGICIKIIDWLSLT